MSKESDLRKLIELYGDQEKYSKGLQILNSGLGSNGGALINLAIGIVLIGTAIALSPNLQTQIKERFLRQSEPQVEPSFEKPEQLDKPPLPPEIQASPVPLPPSPLPIEPDQPVTSMGYQSPQSLVYRR